MTDQPIDHGFEYEVRLAVAIPLPWATALREAALSHYDAKCREVGMHGVINGLFNVATWNEKEPGSASTHPVTWRDCDTMVKVMEQSSSYTSAIRQWLQSVTTRITDRHEELETANRTWAETVKLQKAEDRS